MTHIPPTGPKRTRSRLQLALAVTAVAATTLAVGPAVAGPALHCGAPLRDLTPTAASPFDGSTATLELVPHDGASTLVLGIKGVDPSVAGRTFGAHLHSGPCVTGSGAAAGPHYNHSGTVPATVNDETEVWLDFTVTGGGTGRAVSHVAWVPEPGQRSVVVHERATSPDGTAGARLACLPVVW